ncbi:MAG: TolC family protein [Bacteroides stercoris]|nr:TolC family protein [Bacteroides stercoris]
MKQILLIIFLGASVSATAQILSLSFDDALRQMQQGNRSLKIADKGIETARTERDKLNALWYPSLQGAGTFVHLSEKIEVKQPLSQFTDPAKDFVHNLVPDDQFISSILDQIGSHTLAFPLAPRNLSTVGLTAEWIVFSGGKRIRAGKIGNAMIDIARENREQTDATQRVLLAESYFGLRLAQEVVRVRQDTYNSLKRHYENALKLEAAGMIDKAGRLFAQVNMDEAQRSLEASQKEAAVLQNALRTLLNIRDTCSIQPVSPLFINAVLPAKEEFLQTMQTENYTVNQLQLQSHIAKQQLRIEQSGYLPDIAVFGKQTLYAHGIQSNLVPRTMIGVGFTWNLFDGLAREKRIRQSKITQQALSIGQEKAKDDLSVGIDKLYTQMQKAQDNVRALNTTIELSEELVRIRKKSFTEGMATSTEVIDSETMLATVRVARLAAYYEYDVALMNLLALCGTPEEFGKLSKLRIKK